MEPEGYFCHLCLCHLGRCQSLAVRKDWAHIQLEAVAASTIEAGLFVLCLCSKMSTPYNKILTLGLDSIPELTLNSSQYLINCSRDIALSTLVG